MNEEQFRRELRRRSEERALTFMTGHPWKSSPGAPDAVIFGPGGLLVTELKSETGRRSQAQVAFGRMFGPLLIVEYRLLRPSDLDNGFVDDNLRWAARRP